MIVVLLEHILLNIYLQKKINLVKIKHKSKNKKFSESYYRNFWAKIIDSTDTIVYLSFNNDLKNLNKNLFKSVYQNLIPLFILNEIIKKKAYMEKKSK